MSGERMMGCSRGRDRANHGLLGISGVMLRERNLLETTETDFLFSSFEC